MEDRLANKNTTPYPRIHLHDRLNLVRNPKNPISRPPLSQGNPLKKLWRSLRGLSDRPRNRSAARVAYLFRGYHSACSFVTRSRRMKLVWHCSRRWKVVSKVVPYRLFAYASASWLIWPRERNSRFNLESLERATRGN